MVRMRGRQERMDQMEHNNHASSAFITRQIFPGKNLMKQRQCPKPKRKPKGRDEETKEDGDKTKRHFLKSMMMIVRKKQQQGSRSESENRFSRKKQRNGTEGSCFQPHFHPLHNPLTQGLISSRHTSPRSTLSSSLIIFIIFIILIIIIIFIIHNNSRIIITSFFLFQEKNAFTSFFAFASEQKSSLSTTQPYTFSQSITIDYLETNIGFFISSFRSCYSH